MKRCIKLEQGAFRNVHFDVVMFMVMEKCGRDQASGMRL